MFNQTLMEQTKVEGLYFPGSCSPITMPGVGARKKYPGLETRLTCLEPLLVLVVVLVMFVLFAVDALFGSNASTTYNTNINNTDVGQLEYHR